MIPVHGFHIEPTNICTLKCAGCARTQFIDQWPRHWANHNLDINDLLNFLDIDMRGLPIHFCGNYGDPIYHPDFPEMVRRVKDRGAVVTITTNGSYRKPEWWIDLCSKLHDKDVVRFSIDGTPENFTQYRENADWTSIREGIETCVAHRIKTHWKFIPFAFNQDSIDQARLVADELGIDKFLVNTSDRFDCTTEHLRPTPGLVAWRVQARKQNIGAVDPKCSTGYEHFITASGHYAPCCYVADHRFLYKTPFGKDKTLFDIRQNTFSKLIQNSVVIDFFGNLQTSPPSVCQFNCPKKPFDQ